MVSADEVFHKLNVTYSNLSLFLIDSLSEGLTILLAGSFHLVLNEARNGVDSKCQ